MHVRSGNMLSCVKRATLTRFCVRQMGTSFRSHADLGGGKEVVFETGQYARLADGAGSVQVGNLCVLGTAVQNGTEAFYADRQPLRVEYRERAVAVGRIADTRTRREALRSDHEELTAALVQHALLPSLGPAPVCDWQVLLTLLSSDASCDAAAAAINAASLALLRAGAPSCVGAVRAALLADGEVVAGPTVQQRAHSTLDILYAGNEEGCSLLWGVGQEAAPSAVSHVISHVQPLVLGLVQAQRSAVKPLVGGEVEGEVREATGEEVRRRQQLHRPSIKVVPTDDLLHSIRVVASGRIQKLLTPVETDDASGEELSALLHESASPKVVRESVRQLENDTLRVLQGGPEAPTREMIARGFARVMAEQLWHTFQGGGGISGSDFAGGRRTDGRGAGEGREGEGSVAVLPAVHGSALYESGHTQVLATVALGPLDKAVVQAGYVTGEVYQPLLCTWQRPPYASGTVNREGFRFGRHEVLRSELLRGALQAAFPSDTGYAVRLHAEVLSDDGGQSSAAINAASLALYDAGVKMSRHVGGVAVGMARQEGEGGEGHVLLLDPTAIEEDYGAMVLHVAGTRYGCTACSLELAGASPVPVPLLLQALSLAAPRLGPETARLFQVMEAPNHVPRGGLISRSLSIDPLAVGTLIGPGGAAIRRIEAQTRTQISVNRDGSVSILGKSEDDVAEASRSIAQSQKQSQHQDRDHREGDQDFQDDGTDLAVTAQPFHVVVPVPSIAGLVPRLIGRGRRSEKEMARLSGCAVRVTDDGVTLRADSEEQLLKGSEIVKAEIEKMATRAELAFELPVPLPAGARSVLVTWGSEVEAVEKETATRITVASNGKQLSIFAADKTVAETAKRMISERLQLPL